MVEGVGEPRSFAGSGCAGSAVDLPLWGAIVLYMPRQDRWLFQWLVSYLQGLFALVVVLCNDKLSAARTPFPKRGMAQNPKAGDVG